MIQVTIAGYTIRMAEAIPERFGGHEAIIEEFELERVERHAFYVEVRRESNWPLLCVAQRYSPNHWAGSYPTVLLAPETHILFIGAGERLLAYDLTGPVRLWEDTADCGIHDWQRHGDILLMSAELELAAWDIRGTKLWSTFVEPPWVYQVEGSTVYLRTYDPKAEDAMGAASAFSLIHGPHRR